jgi:hypothetical protein
MDALEGQLQTLQGENQVLQDQVGVLESDSALLQQELSSVQAESDLQPILIDANGVRVGVATHWGGGDDVAALLDLEGFPLFQLRFKRDGVRPQGFLWFASANCTGQPYVSDSGRLPGAFSADSPSGECVIGCGTIRSRMLALGARIPWYRT